MRSVIFAALLGAACAASAQMYRWTDEKGRVHVTDTPPPPSAKAVQKKSFSGGGTAVSDSAGQPYALQLAAKSFPVTLYTSKDCEPCGAARNLLNARGVPFREVLVVDEPQQEELRKVAGALAVPSVTVGSNVQKGFEENAYHSLLDIAGYPKAGILTPRNQAEPKPVPPPDVAEGKPAEEEDAAASGPYAPGSASTGVRTRK
jgi:glutaredoxin